MSYIVLFFGGLLIGVVFLVILLIGDRREAIAKAKEEALRRMTDGASAYTAGTWPPPPTERSASTPPSKAPTPAKLTRRHVNNFHWAIWFFRFFLFAMAAASYLVHGLFPSMRAPGIIALSAAISVGIFALWVLAARGRSR